MTIPDEYVTRAARALLNAQGCTTPLADMHPEDAGYALNDAQAAIHAIAADIWEEGYEKGHPDGYHDGAGHPGFAYANNPYEQETA